MLHFVECQFADGHEQTRIQVAAVPRVEESIEFDEEFPDADLAGRDFTVRSVTHVPPVNEMRAPKVYLYLA